MMEYTINGAGNTVLGHSGENHCTAILIPVPDDLLDHSVKIYFRLPSSSVPVEIPEASYTLEGNFIRWTISNKETQRSGEGQFQICFTKGKQTIKSQVYKTLTLRSIDE